jgi:O-antigen/teichoic acid export membrane protein
METGLNTNTVSRARLTRAITWVIRTLAGSKKGIKDVIVSMVPQVVSLGTGLFTSVLVARGLGPGGLGEYALVVSVSDMTTTLSDLGIGQTALRYASRAAGLGDPDGQMGVLRWAFQRRMSLVILISVIAYVCAPTVAAEFWHVSRLGPLIRLGLLIGAFGALAHVPSIYFQSLKKFHVNSAVLTGQAIISFTGILALAALRHWSVEAVILVSVVTAGAGASIFLVLVPKQALLAGASFPSSPGRALRSLWSNPTVPVAADHDMVETPNEFALYMLLSSVFVMLTLKADVWLMGFFLGTRPVGVYNAATRLTVPLAVLLAAMNTALWPRASSLVRIEDKIALLRKTLRLCSMIALAGIAYAIGVPMLAPLLFGARYAKSVSLGQLLCIRYLLAILVCPVGVIGYSLGLVRMYWIVNLLQLMAVVGINSLLLRVIGPVASTIALITNEVVGFVGVAVLIWRKVGAKVQVASER